MRMLISVGDDDIESDVDNDDDIESDVDNDDDE